MKISPLIWLNESFIWENFSSINNKSFKLISTFKIFLFELLLLYFILFIFSLFIFLFEKKLFCVFSFYIVLVLNNAIFNNLPTIFNWELESLKKFSSGEGTQVAKSMSLWGVKLPYFILVENKLFYILYYFLNEMYNLKKNFFLIIFFRL